MKKICFSFILLVISISAVAQRKLIDTLRVALNSKIDDTTRINKLLDLGHQYYISNPDSAIIFCLRAYELAEKYHLELKQARSLNNMATGYASLGDYARGTQMFFKALAIYRKFDDVPSIILAFNNLGDASVRQGDYKKALSYLLPANKTWNEYLRTHQATGYQQTELRAIVNLNISECYLYTHKIDSADYYLQASYKESKAKKFIDLLNNVERDLGEVALARGQTAVALNYLREAAALSITNDDSQMLSVSYLSTAKLYLQGKRQDSAEYYAQKALAVATAGKFEQDILNASKMLYSIYDESGNLPMAYQYYKLSTAAKDSIYSQDKVKQLLSLDFEEKLRQQEITAAQEQYREKVRMYALIAGLVVLLLLAIIFWRNNRQKQKANNLLNKQKEEIESQRDDLERALEELKNTQTQLVQREKMASLGELTAGIAHEIQNPLNFVNNFSEVNREMLTELKEALKAGDTKEALAIAADLEQNEDKINHHGKRADSIVKGMLEHSRVNAGEHQLIDLNALTEEYLRLAYHGLRGKDKAFNAELITDLDASLPLVHVVPQDMSRVLINLFNNALYAVNQKSKIQGAGYKPEVRITTATENGNVIIKIKDNGIGIPDLIKEKIMQPFFTTKPTGEGTGLGLSLSYDIVVKGHGGTINFDTKEGEYTEFTIILPSANR